jgi:phosphatidate cytidylyltransferase
MSGEEPPRRADLDRVIDLFEGLEEEPTAERRAERKPEPRRRRRNVLRGETARRVFVAIPWIAFAIAITVVGDLPFAVAVLALGLVCLRELFVMTSELRPIQVAAYVALVAMVAAAHFGTAFNVLLALAACFPLLFFFGADRKHRDGVTLSLGVTTLAILWIGLPLVHAVLLRGLPDHGAALLIDVLVGTFVADTGAYATGRMFGSHRIAPSLSPNKTLEGLVGGFVIGTMGFWFAGLYQDWLSGTDALLIGAAVAAVAPVGDLFASLIKRDLDRKDTGRLFGPHGGLLDRLDAVLFTVVVGYYLSLQLVY